MMRKTILLFTCLLSFSYSHAQYFNFTSNYVDLNKYNTIDSAYIKCSYKLTYLKDTLKQNDKSTDLQILLIGKTISKYFSLYKLDYNHYIMKEVKKGVDAVNNIKERGAWSYELYKNYPQGKETVTDIASMLNGNFIYEEDLPVFDWKIYDEKQTILSYSCQKATVSFRGRIFIAWFTADIPVPNGPWKFGGLPGLILKLSDSENNFVYECAGLEQLKQKEPINFYTLDYAKVSRRELAKTYQRFHDDMVAYMEALGIQVRIVGGSKTLKISYNPIELE